MIARARGALWDRWNKLPECPGEMYSREAHELAKATLAAALDPEDEKLVEIVARDTQYCTLQTQRLWVGQVRYP